MPLIKCENVSIGYEGQTVVKDLNFAIEKGDYLCIVGENGSGHGDVFTDNSGKYYYVYHVHASDTTVTPRRTRIVPLKMQKDESGIYDISIMADSIIKPCVNNKL